MGRNVILCAVVVAFVVLSMSCSKTPWSRPVVEGSVKMEIVKCGNAIPAAWGDVISVSSVGQYEGWVQVWFQDEAGDLYMIPYHVPSNTFHNNYRHLRRK